MSTTPTPNNDDWEVQSKSYWEVEHGEPAKAVFNYRLKIEAAQAKRVEHLQVSLGKERSESQRFLQRLGETVIECNHLKERIATLEKALSEAEYALKDLLNHGTPIPNPYTGEPEPYQSNPELAEQALTAIRQAKGQA